MKSSHRLSTQCATQFIGSIAACTAKSVTYRAACVRVARLIAAAASPTPTKGVPASWPILRS